MEVKQRDILMYRNMEVCIYQCNEILIHRNIEILLHHYITLHQKVDNSILQIPECICKLLVELHVVFAGYLKSKS